MPAKSEKQRRLMQAVKHDPAVAKKTGISPYDASRVLGEGEGKKKKSNNPYLSDDDDKHRYKKSKL